MSTSPPRRGKKFLPKASAAEPDPKMRPPKWADTSFRSLLEAAPDAMLVVDRAGEIVVANLQAQNLYGYSREHLIGKVVESLTPARLRDRHRQHRENFFANPETQAKQVLEIFAVRSDASEIPVDVSLSLLTIGSETFAISATRDATERRRIEELKRAEAVLRETRESEQRFRLIADTAPVLIWMSGADQLCTYFNKSWLDFTGRSIDSELGNGWAEGVHPEDLRRCMDTYTHAFDRREEFRMEYRLRRHDGEFRWVLDIGVPRSDQDRSFVGYIGIGVDITERKQAEERLREYERVIQGLEERIMVVDREYRYVIANHAFLQYRGMEREQVVGHFVPEVVGKEVFETVIKGKMDECFKGKVVQYELKYRYTNLGERDLFVSYFPIEGPTGVNRIAIVLRDVTERKRAEDAIRESEKRYRRIVETTSEGVWLLDSELHTSYVNRQMEEMLGYEPGEMVGRSVFDFYFREDFEHKKQALKRRQQGLREQIDERLRRRDGSELWVRMAVSSLIKDNGEFDGALAMVCDITEHKRAEEALHESEGRFHLAAQAGKMFAYEWDAATDVIVRSGDCAEILGIDNVAHVTTGQQILAKVYPDDREKLLAADAALSAEKPHLQVSHRMVRPDGSVIWVERTGRAHFDGQGKILRIVGMVADITERKHAEGALRESEDRLRLLLDSTAEAIYGVDLEHRCTFCNPACLRALGYERVDELLGKNVHELIHHTRADGTLFPVEECRVHRVTQTGEGVHADDEVLWRANGTSFPAEYWSYPQRRGHEVVGAVVAFIDITERKLAEAALASVSRKLIEAQEQERTRIGRELHDDIGQRLAMLAIEIQQLHEDPPSLPEVHSRMGELQKRISEIAADTQSLSHELHSAKLQYLGIAAAMRGFCQEFGEQQKAEIDFKTHDLPSPLSPDISLCFFRVLQEALHNSAKHSGVRHFEVRLWGTSDEIHLTVKDSGAGFDREAAKTSRGLGLVSMEERLKLVKGTLSIDSQPKRGTTIHARIPLGSGSDSMRAAG